MSMIGNMCPTGVTVEGTNLHPFTSRTCVDRCINQCMPASILVQIEEAISQDKHTGEYISVTGLLGCLRQTYLERSIPYYLEPAKSWWKLRGKIVHSLLEGSAGIPDWYTEVEYKYKIGVVQGKEYWLRGTIDVLRPVMGRILDYKTLGDKGLESLKYGLKQDHIMQFNMYRFLALHGTPVDRTDLPPVKEIASITSYYLTMMQVACSGGVYEEKTIFRDSEPPCYGNELSREVIGTRQDLVLKKGKRKANAQMDDYEVKTKRRWKINYRIPSVPLLSLDEIKDFIHTQAPKMIAAFAEGTIPEMCSPDTRKWKCDYCPAPVLARCDEINKADGVERIITQDMEDGIPMVTI